MPPLIPGSVTAAPTLELSTDGLNYTLLGAGTRITGGWQLSGLSLPQDPGIRIRARGIYSSRSASIVEQVAAVFDDAPSVANIALSIAEDTVLAFSAAIFDASFADPESTALQSVLIVSFPASGTLRLSGVPVVAGQQIARAQLSNLTFTPAPDFFGSESFGWNGSDGVSFAVAGAAVNVSIAPAAGRSASSILLESASAGGRQAHVSFIGTAGQSYQLQSTDTFSPTAWTPRATVPAGATGVFEFIDRPPLPAQRFYRAISVS